MKNDNLIFPCAISPDLESMSKKEIKLLIVRLHQLELKAWGQDSAFSLMHIKTHFSIFPEGAKIAYLTKEKYENLEPSAWGLCEIVKYNLERPVETWYGVTDDGFIARTHDENGDWLYGVNLTIPPGVPISIGYVLLHAGREIAYNRNLKGMIIGSRIPRYYKYAHEMSVDDYVEAKIGKRYKDPELARYSALGFEIVRCKNGNPKILKNYFEDPESLNYGVLMVWKNEKYKKGGE